MRVQDCYIVDSTYLDPIKRSLTTSFSLFRLYLDELKQIVLFNENQKKRPRVLQISI